MIHGSILFRGKLGALAAKTVAQAQRPAAFHLHDFDAVAADGGVVAGPVASQAGTGLSTQTIQEAAE